MSLKSIWQSIWQWVEAVHMNPGFRRILKGVGYPLFFFICFSFFLGLTFPEERFIPAVESQLSELLGRDVTVGDMSISPFGSMILSDVQVEIPVDEEQTPRDDESGDGGEEGDSDDGAQQKPAVAPRYMIDEVDVDVGIFALLLGRLSVDVEMDFLGGVVEISWSGAMPGDEEPVPAPTPDAAEPDGEPARVSLIATDLNLSQFFELREFLPLPLLGTMSFALVLETETGRFKDAAGSFTVVGRNLSLGQGQTPVEVIDGMGPMTVDALAISSLDMAMEAKGGVCTFREFKLVSNDVAVTAEGDIRFADPLSRSHINLYFAFRLLEGYEARSDRAKTLVSMMPTALASARRSDGSYGYAYTGLFKDAKFRPRRTFGARDRRGVADDGDGRGSSRRLGMRAMRNRAEGGPVLPEVRDMDAEKQRLQAEMDAAAREAEARAEGDDAELDEETIDEADLKEELNRPPSIADIEQQKADASARAAAAAAEAKTAMQQPDTEGVESTPDTAAATPDTAQ